jgi:hypothetical protein
MEQISKTTVGGESSLEVNEIIGSFQPNAEF